MSILMVTYVGDAGSRFDRKYYDAQHIPLVERTWQPFGLQRTEVFYPDDAGAVVADIANFTDIEPMRTVVNSVR